MIPYFSYSAAAVGGRRGSSFVRRNGCWLIMVVAALSVRGAEMQLLHGHVLPCLRSLTPTDRLPATNQLNLAICLPLRNKAALSNLLRQIYDPASPQYRHYLTPDQFTERFGPTEQDYQAVIAFAKANHLQVTRAHPNRVLLDVSGSVAEVEQALHITLHTYPHPTENRQFYAPDTEPSLALSVPVLHICGLDNYALPRPHLHATRLVQGQNASPNGGSGPGGEYMGKDFRAAYVPDSTLDGSGQVVGLLEFDGYTTNDITYYENNAGLPNVPLQNVLVDGATGTGANIEVSLDIEMAISMATNLSKVIVYEEGPAGSFPDIENRMANDNLASQLSCSWFAAGGVYGGVDDQIFQQMAAQGQSFFNASGDADAYTGLIEFPGDTPYVTEVGGTTLTTGPGGSWASETVWNFHYTGPNGVGSGGGISTQYPIPTWQTNINMTANQGSTTMRNTPDVALNGDNVYVRAGGRDYKVSGTSCAAPLWAGFAALVNQQMANTGQPVIGFINPAVYAIGASSNYATAFHDITNGNNTWTGSLSKFYAVPGYDLCTGWGTPAGQSLINALGSDPLLILPTTGFSAIGGMSGPFSVSSQNYTLTDIGTNGLTWTLSNTPAWLSVSSTGGLLATGGPASTVMVSLNNVASNLVVGAYNATLWFTNVNDNVGQSRQFSLSVISPPGITQQPTNLAVLGGTTAAFSVQLTGGSPLAYRWQFNGTNLADDGHLSGSGTTNLTINDVSTGDVGIYTFIATNFAGTAVSSNASLAITPSPPVIVSQPMSQVSRMGGVAEFAVSVIGTPPFSYLWEFNGTNLVNATNATLTLTNVQLSQFGSYAVLITNSLGSVSSSNAVLTVVLCDPVPSGIVAWWGADGNANDSIGTNNGVLEGGAAYAPGELGLAFSLDGTNGCVFVPASPSLNVGSGSGFTIEAWINPSTTNAQQIILGWQDPASGALGVYLETDKDRYERLSPGTLYAIIQDVNPNYGGLVVSPTGILKANQFQHIALTYNGISQVATLYVNGLVVAQSSFPVITPKTSFALYLGERLGSPLNFKGLLDEISIYNRALSSAEIQVIYAVGSYGKCPLQLSPPAICQQPAGQPVQVGDTVALSVIATGMPPLSYQWSFNGTNLVNATNATLTLTNLQFSQSGNYAALVTNLYGSTNSAIAVLTVYALPPSVTAEPTNQTVQVGGTVALVVTAGGTPPLAYQWNFNETNISGATNATLTLTNVQFSQAGNYSVLVSNAYGSTNSAVAVLDVNSPPPPPLCDPAPSGIVSWWPADGNANDVVGANNGIASQDVAYVPALVGEGFQLGDSNAFVTIPPSATLNIGTNGTGLTLEAWIDPTNVSGFHPIFEWNPGFLGVGAGVGVYLWLGQQPSDNGLLVGNIQDTVGYSGNSHTVASGENAVVAGQYQHVALTYDPASGNEVLYLNGAVVAQQNIGRVVPQTWYHLYLGRRPNDSPGDSTYGAYFGGIVDQPSIYQRALSSNEIVAIYLIGSAGKCLPSTPPFITSQPTNQTVVVGGMVAFSVAATGTLPLDYLPLDYQWNFNGTNISGATNATLILTYVQPGQAGDYAVQVTNLYGSAVSSNATLTVVDILDHFAWIPVSSPRFIKAPFSVTVQAMDPANQLFTNYTGVVLLATTNGVPVNPPGSGHFVQGAWTGSISIPQAVSNLVLKAYDGAGGHVGLANPINVVGTPSLQTVQSGGFLLMFWPMDPSGFVLESSPSLVTPQWTQITSPPQQIGNQNLQTVQINNTNQFYRLHFILP